MLPDHTRPRPITSRFSGRPPRFTSNASYYFPRWSETCTDAALRLSGKPGDPDDGVEGRFAGSRIDTGHRSRRLHPRISQSSTRRGYGRTENQPDSMWAGHTISLWAYTTVAAAERHQYLMTRTTLRKRSSMTELENCWKRTLARSSGFSYSTLSRLVSANSLRVVADLLTFSSNSVCGRQPIPAGMHNIMAP